MGYSYFGLVGAGIGVTLTTFVYLAFILPFYKWMYGFHLSPSVIGYAAAQLPIGLLAYAATFVDQPIIYWPSGIVLCAVSALVSLHFIRKRTHLWEKVPGIFKIK